MRQIQNTFGGNRTSNSKLWSFPELVMYATILSGDAGQQQGAIAPRQARDHKGKQPIPRNAFIVLMICYTDLPNCRLI